MQNKLSVMPSSLSGGFLLEIIFPIDGQLICDYLMKELDSCVDSALLYGFPVQLGNMQCLAYETIFCKHEEAALFVISTVNSHNIVSKF